MDDLTTASTKSVQKELPNTSTNQLHHLSLECVRSGDRPAAGTARDRGPTPRRVALAAEGPSEDPAVAGLSWHRQRGRWTSHGAAGCRAKLQLT